MVAPTLRISISARKSSGISISAGKSSDIMKPPRPSQPPSRRGKRQLMVFLDAKFAETVRNRAVKREKTAQEMLAEAMNVVLESHGRKAVFPVGHARFMVRKKAVAVPRRSD